MASAVLPLQTARAERQNRLISLFPSLTDFAFLLPLVLVLFHPARLSMLLADGDTGWHIRTGDWILAHRAVPHVDLFSFTKPNEPW
ncbi:MAG: hypothetical protein M3Y72_07140, partial [Acidobacteriota bacterium]|nr:hypothetical protein [Acidobacteriota bacterium]